MPLDDAMVQTLTEYSKDLAKKKLDEIKEFSNEECTKTTNDISHTVC